MWVCANVEIEDGYWIWYCWYCWAKWKNAHPEDWLRSHLDGITSNHARRGWAYALSMDQLEALPTTVDENGIEITDHKVLKSLAKIGAVETLKNARENLQQTFMMFTGLERSCRSKVLAGWRGCMHQQRNH